MIASHLRGRRGGALICNTPSGNISVLFKKYSFIQIFVILNSLNECYLLDIHNQQNVANLTQRTLLDTDNSNDKVFTDFVFVVFFAAFANTFVL